MLNKLKPQAPMDGMETLDQFKHMALLISVLFGPGHVLFIAYNAFVLCLAQEQFQLHRYHQICTPSTGCSFWMKINALQLSSCFEEVSMSSGPLPPLRNLTRVFD